MLEFILIMFIGLLGFLLVRYHVAVRDFSQQIREKRETGSQIRLAPQNHSQTIVELANEVEKLFQEVEQTRFIARQEKKTLDMAISNIAHDIRTPLTIASGYTQQLIKGKEENEQLLKIATNLSVVSNRLEALMEYHGKENAQLSLIRKDAAILLSVKNIVRQPIQHLEKLTNRFYSENLSNTEESSGLGLYITQQLVDILGGDLTMKAKGNWFELLVRL